MTHFSAARLLPIVGWWLTCLLLISTLPGRAQLVNPADLPDRPNPPRLVNDFAGALQPDEIQRLEDKLVAYNDSTSSQITIVIVKTTEPYVIGDYAFGIGRKWGVGQKGKSNGMVIAWATETRKVFIATGYGFEGSVPDGIAKRIINETIRPAFKAGKYYQGLDEATTEIIARAKGEYKADPQATDNQNDGSDGSEIFIWIFVIALILFFVFRNRGGGRGGNRSRGGGFMPPVFFPTTYSGWGGSSGGSGGGGGGGFGGFGGGDFGGGGAGGDY
jgi:uncharacterized protein